MDGMVILFVKSKKKNPKMSFDLSKFHAVMVALAFHHSFARTVHAK